jgi:hypothetical protein
MEPERPIEKALRAYASKRRDEAGAPLELHPVTRKVLHDEIGRKFPKPERKNRTFLNVLAQFWPRFAFAFGTLAVLALVLFVVLPDKDRSSSSYAFSERKPAGTRAEEATRGMAAPAPDYAPPDSERLEIGKIAPEPVTVAKERVDSSLLAESTAVAGAAGALNEPAPAPITSPTLQFEDRRAAGTPVASAGEIATVDGKASRSFATATQPASKEPLVAQTPAPLSTSNGKLAAVDALQSRARQEIDRSLADADRTQLALKAPASPAPTASAGALLFKAESVKQYGVDLKVAQRFSQVSPPTKSKAAADKSTPVLAAFQVEQTGGQLKITDNDGSTYTGSLQQAPTVLAGAPVTESADNFAVEKKRMNAVDASALAVTQNKDGQTYSFSVSGTNRTLNEPIIFNGELAVTNAALSFSVTNVVNDKLKRDSQPTTLRLDSSRIKGRAKIGNQSEIEVEALPTPR